jgi:hypothetical protein
LFSGNHSEITDYIFSNGAHTSLVDNGNEPRTLLEKICDLKKKRMLLPGRLFPATVVFSKKAGDPPSGHEANVIVPKINSIADAEDGQFVPLVWTNWLGPCQWGVIRRGNEYEWVDDRGQHVNMLKLSLCDPEKNKFTPYESTPTT